MPETADDKKWRAEMDARTLAEASAVNSDPARKKAAVTASKRLVADEQKRAKAQAAQANAMKRLASGKADGAKPKAKAAKPAARKSAPAKRSSGGKRKR